MLSEHPIRWVFQRPIWLTLDSLLGKLVFEDASESNVQRWAWVWAWGSRSGSPDVLWIEKRWVPLTPCKSLNLPRGTRDLPTAKPSIFARSSRLDDLSKLSALHDQTRTLFELVYPLRHTSMHQRRCLEYRIWAVQAPSRWTNRFSRVNDKADDCKDDPRCTIAMRSFGRSQKGGSPFGLWWRCAADTELITKQTSACFQVSPVSTPRFPSRNEPIWGDTKLYRTLLKPKR